MAIPADKSLVGVEGFEKRVCQVRSPRLGSAKDSGGFVEVYVVGRTTTFEGRFAGASIVDGYGRTARPLCYGISNLLRTSNARNVGGRAAN